MRMLEECLEITNDKESRLEILLDIFGIKRDKNKTMEI